MLPARVDPHLRGAHALAALAAASLLCAARASELPDDLSDDLSDDLDLSLPAFASSGSFSLYCFAPLALLVMLLSLTTLLRASQERFSCVPTAIYSEDTATLVQRRTEPGQEESLVVWGVELCHPICDLRFAEHVSMSCSRGEIIAVLGKSGIARSEFLEWLAGYRRVQMKSQRGHVLLGGRDVSGDHSIRSALSTLVLPEDENLRYYMQAHMRTMSVLLAEVRVQRPGTSRLEAETLALKGFGLVGLDALTLEQDVSMLSVSQLRRVQLAIALLFPKPVLVLDDFTRGLDAFSALELTCTIRQIGKDLSLIVIVALQHPARSVLAKFHAVAIINEIDTTAGEIVYFGPLCKTAVLRCTLHSKFLSMLIENFPETQPPARSAVYAAESLSDRVSEAMQRSQRQSGLADFFYTREALAARFERSAQATVSAPRGLLLNCAAVLGIQGFLAFLCHGRGSPYAVGQLLWIQWMVASICTSPVIDRLCFEFQLFRRERRMQITDHSFVVIVLHLAILGASILGTLSLCTQCIILPLALEVVPTVPLLFFTFLFVTCTAAFLVPIVIMVVEPDLCKFVDAVLKLFLFFLLGGYSIPYETMSMTWFLPPRRTNPAWWFFHCYFMMLLPDKEWACHKSEVKCGVPDGEAFLHLLGFDDEDVCFDSVHFLLAAVVVLLALSVPLAARACRPPRTPSAHEEDDVKPPTHVWGETGTEPETGSDQAEAQAEAQAEVHAEVQDQANQETAETEATEAADETWPFMSESKAREWL